ncbi:hypothetical protein [Lentzea terrae]|uniref:hypothetical protein n=1 Tax=Lentzea terrae TaxID=2200761 RepID=UPI000DD3BB8F|nr:hypothetical protein [Lentzea terrae]
MSIGGEHLGELLRQLVAVEPQAREVGAETVCDWSGSLAQVEARLLVRVLSAAAAIEGVSSVREAMLHAAAEIFDASFMDVHDVAPVFAIEEGTLDPSEQEYVQGLGEELAAVSRAGLKVAPWAG